MRRRDLSGQPMSLLKTWVPAYVGAKTEGKEMSLTPLLILLERADAPIASATQTISAMLVDARIASILGFAGAPLIDVRRVVFGTSERPVEYTNILYHPELSKIQMSMRRLKLDADSAWQNAVNPAHVWNVKFSAPIAALM